MDKLLYDLRYAVRTLAQTPGVACTVILTLGLGLGLVAAVFTIFNAYIFRADEVRDPHELFAVRRQPTATAEAEPFTPDAYDALLRETEIFTDAMALGPQIDRWIDGQRMEGPLVTGNFFQVLGVNAALGRTFTAADDLAGNRVLVLGQRAWQRYFAGDPGIIGRTVRVNEMTFDVLGVMPAGFRGLGIDPPDFWMPLALAGDLGRGADGALPVDIVGRLRPGMSHGEALARLGAWDMRRSAETTGARPAASLVIEPRQGKVPLSVDTMLTFLPLFFAFGLILLIGCANVANLLFARGVARQREIGIRFAIGASRRRIVRQLLTESLVLALAAATFGFGVSRLVLAAVVNYVTSAMTGLGDIRLALMPADWRVVLFLVAAAIASTLCFALVPALRATRVELAQAMHGAVTHDARPGRARNMLIALQVTGSVLLLICAAIFLRSSWRAASNDPGVRIADTVFLGIGNEQARDSILDAVRADPEVAALAAMSPAALRALAGTAAGKSAATYRWVSPEYFDILGVAVMRGRLFTPDERGAPVAVVSERMAQALWPGRDPLGQELRLEPDPNEAEGAPVAPAQMPRFTGAAVVIGVARDVAGFRVGGATLLAGPDVYLQATTETAGTSLALRVRGDPASMVRGLRERLATIDPAIGEIVPLQELARMEATLLEIPFWLTLALGALALVLTLSGLFSVLTYLVAQRTREIGVRIALGATRYRISALALAQSIRPVGIGLLLGGGLAAALGALLLATPAAELIGQTVRLFDPLAYGASLLLVIAACAGASLVPALRAGQVDPVTALRRD
jgi:predicted permease